MSTAAEQHVAAFAAAYGNCPVDIPTLGCRILSFDSAGDDLVVDLIWFDPQGGEHPEHWVYPSPETRFPDPNGPLSHPTTVMTDDGLGEVEGVFRYRIDPVAVAGPELRSFLARCRRIDQ